MSVPLIHGRPKYMHPTAWEAFKQTSINPSSIVQTLGSAPSSNGAHASDGTFTNEDGHTEHYCAAVDISVHHPAELSDAEIKDHLDKLWHVGFVAYARIPGSDGWPAKDEKHIHGFFAGLPMKRMLRDQCHDSLHLPILNGLASHAPYSFWHPSPLQTTLVRTLFLNHNPASG